MFDFSGSGKGKLNSFGMNRICVLGKKDSRKWPKPSGRSIQEIPW